MPLHQTIYERLKDVAKARSITYYSEIAPLAGLDMATGADKNRSNIGRYQLSRE